jgi:uncharacterized repeat protein (TIGR01451 family)
LSSDPARSERISDHDNPIAYFTFPPPSADLSLTLTDSPDPALAGAIITYTIDVANNGPDNVANVGVADTIPLDASFVSCNATGGGVCGGIGNIRTVTFASLNIGETKSITLTALVNGSLANNTILRNAAAVASFTRDPELSNNAALTTTTVRRSERITPALQCVVRLSGGAFTARFGYNNPNPVPITIPIGGDNRFTPSPQDRGQPSTFLPGQQSNVFSVTQSGGSLVWILNGRTVTASRNHPTQCPQ